MIEEIILALLGVGFTVTIIFLKKWLNLLEERQKGKLEGIQKEQEKINGKVDDMVIAHHTCREELPRRFAEKKKTEKNFGELFKKMGEVAEGVAYIKGKIG